MTITIDFLSLGVGFALGVAAWGLFLTIVMAAGDIR